jgi:hypothetical protein
MGGDFTFSNANMWYTNLDKLIRAANSKVRYKKSGSSSPWGDAINAKGFQKLILF